MPDRGSMPDVFSLDEWRKALAGEIRLGERRSSEAGRILHDEVGPLLSAAGLHLKVLSLDHPDNSASFSAQLSEIQAMLDRAIDFVRAASTSLNPGTPTRAGLRYALGSFVGHHNQQGGCAITLKCGDIHVVPAVADALFRLFELSVCHATTCGANRIMATLAERPLDWTLEVLYYIASPNSGKNVSREQHQVGLLRLEYAAMRYGARISWDILPDEGALISIACAKVPEKS
jgi:signal transduction histidine kinase